MTAQTYTKKELREFDRLTRMASSRDQVKRIAGRLSLTRFVSEHGDDKCNEMFAELERGDVAKAKKKGAR